MSRSGRPAPHGAGSGDPARSAAAGGDAGAPAAQAHLRLFVAAEVPEAFRSRFAAVRSALGGSVPGARWSRPDAIHLTFKFLGASEASRLDDIGGAVASVTRATPPFDLATGSHGVFGERGRPRVLWTAIEGDLDAARRLASGLEEALEPLGFAREDRPYRPHLTLARFRVERRVEIPASVRQAVETLGGIAFPVHGAVLFESRPAPGGSVYLERQTFRLGQEAV